MSSTSHLAAVVVAAGLLAGCEDTGTSTGAKARRSIPPQTLALMSSKGTSASAPVLIRAYKKEAELEIWKMKGNGEYTLIKSFPMCRWSGQLGPKVREGDRQVPEGFYAITPGQMNPNSAYYLSFNVGYPNALDRAQGHTGGNIMVHGACSSAGCFSMTDEQIAEIYAIAREAFAGGQRAIQMQSFPFRMTAENLAKHRLDQNMPFWRQLKEGSDRFEVTKREPHVNYCGRRYVFDATAAGGQRLEAGAACPPLVQDQQVAALVAEKARADDAKVAELISKGVQPIKLVYKDGGQHPSMSHVMMVSRPEAIEEGPVEVALDANGRPAPPLVQVAASRDDAQDKRQAKAAPAKSGKTEVAQSEPASVPAADPEASGFGRLFSFTKLPSLFGNDEAVKAVETAAPVPLPPRRPRMSGQPVKPHASVLTDPPVRMAMNTPARRAPGAAPILPSDLAR